MRLEQEQEEEQRSNSAVIITSILSLLVVVAAVAVVAWLVLRSPASAVDSAERLEPVGTAISAPTEQPALPTPLPTEPPVATVESAALPEAADNQAQQEAPEEPPAVVGLPTVVSEELDEPAGPTPTPRVIAQPTEIPPTPVPAAPTLPPSIPVTEVPVVALQPVEAAPPVATVAPAQNQESVVSQPTPVPATNDDDPFNIFDEVEIPRIDPAQDPMERVREMQEERESDNGINQVIVPSNDNRNGNGNGNGEDDDRPGRDRVDRADAPVIDVPAGGNSDNPAGVAAMPDVDAMIDEITASTIDRVTNPGTNPNVGDAGRRIAARDDDKKTPIAGSSSRRKNDRDKNRTTQARDDENNETVPGIQRPGSNSSRDDDCSIGDPGFPFC
jgi:hypothetical protein